MQRLYAPSMELIHLQHKEPIGVDGKGGSSDGTPLPLLFNRAT